MTDQSKPIVNLRPDDFDEGVLTLLVGEAPTPPILEPIRVEIIGTHTAPGIFWQKRGIENMQFFSGKCYVKYNYAERSIRLICNEASAYAYRVSGFIKDHPILLKLGINEEKKYDQQSLLKALRVMKPYFTDEDNYVSLMTKLRNVNAVFTSVISQSDDKKGNKKDFIERNFQTEMEWSFRLSCPIFLSTPDTYIHVDITACYEMEKLVFYLESMDLIQQSQALIEHIFDEELLRFQDLVCIETL